MRWLRFLLGTVTITVPATITFIDVVGYVAKVEGASMQPSLNPELENGKRVVDYVFLNRWEARFLNFQRGEVVSLISPSNPDQKIIKRLIALEGDTVRSLNKGGREVRVPSGHCWVEGDNHGQSMDSNFFGPISMGLIQAKANAIVWPPGRWQRLAMVTPESVRLSPAPARGS